MRFKKNSKIKTLDSLELEEQQDSRMFMEIINLSIEWTELKSFLLANPQTRSQNKVRHDHFFRKESSCF